MERIPILSDILDGIKKFAMWLWVEVKYIYAVIAAFILTPVNWCLMKVREFVAWIDQLVDKLDQAVTGMGFDRIGSMWSEAGTYLGMANEVAPVNFAIGCFLGLCGLWILCALIRLIKSFIPTLA